MGRRESDRGEGPDREGQAGGTESTDCSRPSRPGSCESGAWVLVPTSGKMCVRRSTRAQTLHMGRLPQHGLIRNRLSVFLWSKHMRP